MGSALTCPETGEPVPFRVKTDAESVTQAWNQFFQFACPHCGGSHDIKYKEVYMESVIAGFQDDFALVMLARDHRPARKFPP
jgi:hypothetical protein